MSQKSNFEIQNSTQSFLVIKDIGPWDIFPTVTNDAENVVKELTPILLGRRLFYFDSDQELGEIMIRNGEFNGFAPGPETITL